MWYRKKSSMVTYLFFSAYFISVCVSFIIAKNCDFVMGFEILPIYLQYSK